MAIGKCRECGKEVSSEAKTCPGCGVARPIKKTRPITWVIGAILSLAVINAIYRANTAPAPSAATASTSSAPTLGKAEAIAAPAKAEATKKKWAYRSDTDKMTGKEAVYASIDSDEIVNFGFPYQGHNQPTLLLRKHPKYGTSVILQVDKGQFLCRSYDGCYVDVKFDDKPPVRYSATEPADHSTTALFLSPEKKLITEIKKAKTVSISATFYKEGDRVMTFQTAGLDWK